MFPTRLDAADTSNSPEDDTNFPGEMFTDVDYRTTGPHENENFYPNAKIPSERMFDPLDDQQSLGGSDNFVPEVSDDGNANRIVYNESPRGEKYNLRPNLTPNFNDEYRY